MSDDISKQRSPNAPSITLEHAIELTKKLYTAIRNASVKPEVAAKSLNYSGLNGAALTTLGAMSQYGLIDRSKGMVAVTKEAVTILHPMSDAQKQSAIKTLALTPRIFGEINQRYHDCAPSVIESFLVHERFTPEKAQKMAGIYAENVKFANLKDPATVIADEQNDATRSQSPSNPTDSSWTLLKDPPPQPEIKVLAQYAIPLGENTASLVITGDQLTGDDFDALVEFVEFSKRQFERAQGTQGTVFEVRYIGLADLDRKLDALKDKHPGAFFNEAVIATHRAKAMQLDNDGDSVGKSITFSLPYKDFL